MFHFRNGFHLGFSHKPQYPNIGPGLLMNGIICVLFGLLILANPDLIAYLIAFLLIFTGGSMIWGWWKMKNPPKHWSRQ